MMAGIGITPIPEESEGGSPSSLHRAVPTPRLPPAMLDALNSRAYMASSMSGRMSQTDRHRQPFSRSTSIISIGSVVSHRSYYSMSMYYALGMRDRDEEVVTSNFKIEEETVVEDNIFKSMAALVRSPGGKILIFQMTGIYYFFSPQPKGFGGL